MSAPRLSAFMTPAFQPPTRSAASGGGRTGRRSCSACCRSLRADARGGGLICSLVATVVVEALIWIPPRPFSHGSNR